MTATIKFPLPKDRTKTDPGMIVPAADVLHLWVCLKAVLGAKFPPNVKEVVETWFAEEAKKQGWTEIQWVGDVAVLLATVDEPKTKRKSKST